MHKALFLQSELADPYAHYAVMQAEQPVFIDEARGICALYRHADCKRLLNEGSAHIPAQNPAPLNEPASMLVGHLARLANPPAHAVCRHAVMALFDAMQPAATAALLARLLGKTPAEVDWVEAVCRQLPALAVMQGLGFSDADAEAILPDIEPLTAIMLPDKSASQVKEINRVAEEMLVRVERHVAARFGEAGDLRTLYACNLIGLLIQGCDAGRGLLCNALLQTLMRSRCAEDRDDWQRVTLETLRFDPPIHNTRRMLTEDMELGGRLLQRGQAVLLVLAAANRDPAVFEHAAQWNPARANNGEHLTFGAGMHQCAARHFAVALVADALMALFERPVRLLQPEIAYEPMLNARLPKQIMIAVG